MPPKPEPSRRIRRCCFIFYRPLFFFFAGNLLFAFVVSKWLASGYENFVSLSFTILARNSPIALAIALVAFPDKPLVAIALVIGPLIELPVLALVSQILLWIRRF